MEIMNCNKCNSVHSYTIETESSDDIIISTDIMNCLWCALIEEIESLKCHISSQNKVISHIYELFKDGEMPDWLKQYSKGTAHNRKTLEYLEARIKAEDLAKELGL